jgi:hypothetical protein
MVCIDAERFAKAKQDPAAAMPLPATERNFVRALHGAVGNRLTFVQLVQTDSIDMQQNLHATAIVAVYG